MLLKDASQSELYEAMMSAVARFTIAKSEQFTASAANCDIRTIVFAWEYGMKQKVADHVASNEKYPTPDDKVKESSLFLARFMAGDWEERTRASSVPLEVNIARKVTLAALGKADRALLAEMSSEDRAAKLDKTFEANKAALQDSFDKALEAAKAEKPKLGIALAI